MTTTTTTTTAFLVVKQTISKKIEQTGGVAAMDITKALFDLGTN